MIRLLVDAIRCRLDIPRTQFWATPSGPVETCTHCQAEVGSRRHPARTIHA